MFPENSAITDAANTRPARWRRPRWKDPRLAGGVALVAVAVATGAWAVEAAADSEDIYVLTQDLAPGTVLEDCGCLSVVAAHTGTNAYMTVGELPADAVTTQSLHAGELLPISAVGESGQLSQRSVLLSISMGLPEDTVVGDAVDLWQLPAENFTADEGDGAASVAQSLLIASIGEDESSLVGSSSTTVEVLVPEEALPAVLDAVATGDELVLVPTGTHS